jgi:hypothetical protein
MRTTATNRKIRTLLTGVKNGTLIPRPDFQRRLVWTTKHKRYFLDTVLQGYPFPEIYIAAGNVDTETGEGTELLVDGQQRVTTLYMYFMGSSELDLGKEIMPYADLSQDQKTAFLEYEVVVRDLGRMDNNEIKAIFERINATKYSLNDMEIHNARFAGEFKLFAEYISQLPFFENHRIFSATEIRRMGDVSYALTFIITIMSTYFNRDDQLEEFLRTYNDEFEIKEDLHKEIISVLSFIESCGFENNSRVWKKSDLLTLIVEVHRALFKKNLQLDPLSVGRELKSFYSDIDNRDNIILPEDRMDKIITYAKAAFQATNDRINRIRRGDIISEIISSSINQ